MQSGHSDLNPAQVMVLHLQMMSFEVMHDTSIQAETSGTGTGVATDLRARWDAGWLTTRRQQIRKNLLFGRSQTSVGMMPAGAPANTRHCQKSHQRELRACMQRCCTGVLRVSKGSLYP